MKLFEKFRWLPTEIPCPGTADVSAKSWLLPVFVGEKGDVPVFVILTSVMTPLSRGYQDPHFVEAKPSLVLALNRADALVYVGLDLEVGWLPPLVQQSRVQAVQPHRLPIQRLAAAVDLRQP